MECHVGGVGCRGADQCGGSAHDGVLRKRENGGAMVARAGIEPATFHFSGERSYQLSYLAVRPASRPGDPDGTRTRDLRRDRAAR